MNNIIERLQEALWLARNLPLDIPEPEIIVADDGDIEFEWYASKDAVITIWASKKCVSWAGICDGESSHGKNDILYHLPPECVSFIYRITTRMPE